MKSRRHSYLSAARQSPRSHFSKYLTFVKWPPISRKDKGWALCTLTANETCPKCLHVLHHLIHGQFGEMIYENWG